MRAVETWLESRDDEEIITDASRLDKEPLRFENEKGFETDTLMDAPAPSNAVDLPLTLLVKVLYAMADVGLTGFSAIIGFYLNAFLLEVASIPPEAVAFILLGAKLADAFADPLIGYASDKTRTRWGRRKVWVFVFMVPTVVMYAAIWFVPPFSGTGKIAYYALILIFYSMLVSCVGLPVHALAPELTSNYDERTSLMMYKVLFFSAMTIIATFVHSMVIGAFFYPADTVFNNSTACNISQVNNTLTGPQVNAQLGYMVSAFTFAAVAVAPLVLLLFFVPERPVGKKKRPFRRDGSVRIKQFTVWESFVTIVTNRSFVCVTVIYLFSQLAVQFVQNNLLLFIKLNLNRGEWFSYILLLLLGTACLSLPLWELLSRRFGKSKMYLLGALIGIVCFVSAFAMDYAPPHVKDVVIWVTAVIAGLAIGALFLIPVAMLPDAITQDEFRTGVRREGIFYALFILFQKVALAVAVAISNFVLSSSGYISPEAGSLCANPEQPESTKFVLSLMIGIFPAAIMALSLIALAFYPITKELHLDTLQKIEDEKKRNALITTDGEQTAQTHDF